MNSNGPETVQSLQVQKRILEIDVQVADKKADEYRQLLLSFVSEEGLPGLGTANATTSVRPASPSQQCQPRAIVRGLTLFSILETS